MDIDIEPARRGRRPSSKHDSETPAYRIIYGVFESQATFCEETGVPLGTANLWLRTGLIPARRQESIMRAAEEHGRELDRALFVPILKAA